MDIRISFLSFLLGFSLSGVTVTGQSITDICLDCLSRANPVPKEQGCIMFNGHKLCGPFRVSDGFFKDCSKLFTPPPGKELFEDCTLDYECAAQCVAAEHNRVAGMCLAAFTRTDPDHVEMSCADFGRLHFGGFHKCGQPDLSNTELYLQRMTDYCGCQTVYGSCTTTPAAATTTAGFRLSTHQLILYTVPAVCGVILIILVIVLVVVVRSYNRRRRDRRRRENQVMPVILPKDKIAGISQNGHSSPGNRQSQYNPYTSNPQNTGSPTAAEYELSPPAETDDYVSPSSDIPAVVILSNGHNSHLTMLTHPSTDQTGSSDCVYDQALPALPTNRPDTENTDDIPSEPPASPPELDYINTDSLRETSQPSYVNGKYAATLEEGKRQSRGKAPIPVPRETSQSKTRPGLNRAESGLYVEEVDVDKSGSAAIDDQYVVAELGPHYSN